LPVWDGFLADMIISLYLLLAWPSLIWARFFFDNPGAVDETQTWMGNVTIAAMQYL
jgi:hypothetical protein